MDECYWFDNSNGVEDDVKDETAHRYHATSYNTASIDTIGKINYAGHFANDADYVETTDSSAGNTEGNLSVSFWVKLDEQMGRYAVVLTKSKSWDWNDGWGFVNPSNSSGDTLRFFVEGYSSNYVETTIGISDGWVHIVATYDGSVMRLYKNGVSEANNSVSGLTINSNDPIRLADDDGSGGDSTLKGVIDEVKIWNTVLTSIEIQHIFNSESNGLNYDGSPRETITCDASIAAHSWELIGIPADLRTESDTSISKILGDDFTGTYGTDWRIYKREYSDTNNSSWYTYLSNINTALEFGTAYWLGSKNAESWDVNDMQAVDYNSTNSACTAGTCVEIDLKSVSLDESVGDELNGTGPYRYYMTGFTGKSPVNWADCRFIINGTVYTPSDAETAGYVNKQIWQYNPGSSGADSKGYTTCDDVTPGSCMLQPYKGFRIELHGTTKNKTVKL
jgi:hypothetical protein